MTTITIDVDKLIEVTLSIEQYFILDCVYKKNKDLLVQYVIGCGKIEKSNFNHLLMLGYIEPYNEENIQFESIKLTKKALKVFGWEKTFEEYFTELRSVYPKQAGKSKRKLHQDLNRCRKLYKEIVDSEETHNNIIKCIKLYIEDNRKEGKLEYLQMLSTFLHQKNYELYLEEINNNTEEYETNIDVI